MIRLETERLILRNYRPEDVEEVFAYFSNEEVARYEDFDPMSREEVAEMVTDWIPRDHRLVAVRKEDDRLVGSVGYWIEEDGKHSLDYDFNPAFGGKGYATEAAAAVVRYLFEEKGLETLYADCDIRNEKSYKLMERLGFRRVGRLDDQSYKEDAEGKPILISIYLYRLDRKR